MIEQQMRDPKNGPTATLDINALDKVMAASTSQYGKDSSWTKCMTS